MPTIVTFAFLYIQLKYFPNNKLKKLVEHILRTFSGYHGYQGWKGPDCLEFETLTDRPTNLPE